MANYQPLFDFIRSQYPLKERVYLHEPSFKDKEREYLLDALDSKIVSTVGPYAQRLEAQLAVYTGAQHAVALNSGTSALHLSLKLAGLKPGEEVITQALTYVATVNPISYEGGIPLFLDVDKDTMGLSPAALKMFIEEFCEDFGNGLHNKRTGRRIAACMPMHTFGYPCRIDEIQSICEAYGVPLVEDAAEAIGSSYNGRWLGTYGMVGAYSFNGNKTITSGGGGALITENERLAKQARHLSSQAKVPHAWESYHDAIGQNTRMPSLNAALACAQLERLDEMLRAKRELSEEYQQVFRGNQLGFVKEIEGASANHWLNAIILRDKSARNEFLEAASAKAIECRPLWQLMSDLPMYSHCEADSLEHSRYLQERVVALPSSVPVG
ncbi:MAG: LegC family aminotransferase [Bacteroidota bacterium]